MSVSFVWEKIWGDGGGGLVSPDGVAPSLMVSVSASVNLPLHDSPGGPGKRAVKRLCVCMCVCMCVCLLYGNHTLVPDVLDKGTLMLLLIHTRILLTIRYSQDDI